MSMFIDLTYSQLEHEVQVLQNITPEKIEIATLRRVDGKTKIEILKGDEMTTLIKKYEDAEKAAEEAKKEKEKGLKTA